MGSEISLSTLRLFLHFGAVLNASFSIRSLLHLELHWIFHCLHAFVFEFRSLPSLLALNGSSFDQELRTLRKEDTQSSTGK